MQFKFIKKIEGKVKGYDGTEHATGDIIELSGPLADKAKRNPRYELVQEKEALTVKNAK